VKLWATAIVCIAAVALAGCGGSGGKRKATRSSQPATTRPHATPPRHPTPPEKQYLLVGLNRLGWIDGNCAGMRRFSVTLTVPATSATDEVRFSVAGQPDRAQWLDPGKSRTWEVPTEKTPTTVRSRPIRIKLVEPSEPQTLRALVRMRIEQGGGDPAECIVNPGITQQRSISHVAP